MTEQTPEPGPATLRTQRRRNMLGGISYIWMVPLLALIIALAIAWQAIQSRGPLIEVRFASAAGVRAEATELRFRDVRVGVVERLRFAPNMAEVIVSIRVDKGLGPFLDEDAQFWIVSPQVTARGVTGLDTVLSGSYIEGSWDDVAGDPQRAFDGLAQAPLVRGGARGIEVLLQAPRGGQLAAGAPVFFRGVRVGHMTEPQLTQSGDAVEARAFIEAPHDRLITSGTRFWDVSGFSLNLGAGGVELDVESIATLVEGGVSFSTVSSNAQPVAPGTVFSVYATEEEARESVFSDLEQDDLELSLFFDGSISGLETGAPVELEGLRVGSVLNFGAFIQEVDGEPDVRLQVDISLQPRRLELERDADREDALDFLEEAVASGLRARLANQGIFNPALKVELVAIPDPAPAAFERDRQPLPVLPTAPSALSDTSASAEGLLARIQDLPLDEVMNTAISVMRGIETFVGSEALQSAPDAFLGLINDSRDVIQSDALQTLASDLGAAAEEVEALVEGLNEEAAIASLLAALNRAEAVMAGLQDTVEGFPAIVSGLAELTDTANALPLEAFITEATGLVQSTEALLAAEDTGRVPGALADALADFSAVLQDVREGGLIANANSTLASTSAAAESVSDAVAVLPDLTARADALLAQTEALMTAYGARSEFNAQTLGALRELRDTARAVSSLARAIERDPAVLIRGR